MFSLYKQVIKNGLTFKCKVATYKIEISDDLKFITKTLQQKKYEFNLRSYYRNINSHFSIHKDKIAAGLNV